MRNNGKSIAHVGILFALTLIIGTIENLIPPIIPSLPFVKIGFSNIVITFALITCGLNPAFIIAVGKSILVPLFIGNPMMIAYSLVPTIIALIVSFGLIKIKQVSLTTIGAISAFIHNMLQLCCASIIMGATFVFVFAPYLALAGFIAGLITGLICLLLIKYLPMSLIILN